MDFTSVLNKIPKVVQYESIPYAPDFLCPQCGANYIFDDMRSHRLVGYCETKNGFQMIFECQHCFQQYRFHGTTIERYHFDKFVEALWLAEQVHNTLDYQNKKQHETS